MTTVNKSSTNRNTICRLHANLLRGGWQLRYCWNVQIRYTLTLS